jgi:virginiamycin A acetyltransferase
MSHEPGSPVRAGPGAAVGAGVRRALKGAGLALGLTAVVLPAASCWAEVWLSAGDGLFAFWGQTLALAPGLPGKYLRKGFYFLTLRRCSLSCDIGFMSYFNDRRAEVGRRVYIGFGVSLGAVLLGDGCLIGSRVSIINSGDQHRLDPDGRLTAFDRTAVQVVRVGQETWIGEAAVLMADVGSRCIIAAGAVVSSPVPDGCLVGGNPARFIRKLV